MIKDYMAPNAPTPEPEAQYGSISTAEAKYFSAGHPTVIPVKPELTPENTKIYKSAQPREATIISQPHPHDRVAAIIYSPEELAKMGFKGLTVPHSLVSFEHGAAELVPEQRDPTRITLETSEKLGLALEPKAKENQKAKELEGAKARLERHLDALAATIKTAYAQGLAEKFPEPEAISDKTIEITETVLSNELRSQKQHKLANAITPGSLRPFLEATAKQARQNEMDDFNKEDNFTWEDMLSRVINHSGGTRHFSCTTDVAKPLLQANIQPRTVQLDDNPKHTVTISVSPNNELHTRNSQSTIVVDILHESGESFADRYKKRHPYVPSKESRGH